MWKSLYIMMHESNKILLIEFTVENRIFRIIHVIKNKGGALPKSPYLRFFGNCTILTYFYALITKLIMKID